VLVGQRHLQVAQGVMDKTLSYWLQVMAHLQAILLPRAVVVVVVVALALLVGAVVVLAVAHQILMAVLPPAQAYQDKEIAVVLVEAMLVVVAVRELLV
jgi:hypothetical protein